MKILLINNAYQQFGSTDAVVSQERQLLEEHGESVISYERSNAELAGGALLSTLLLPVNSVYSLRTRAEVIKLIKENRPDVAYVHNFLPLVSPSVYHALYACGLPSVQILHEFRLLCPSSVFYTRGQVCERCKDGNYLHAIRYRCYRDSYLATLVCSTALALNRSMGMLDKISGFLCLTEFSKKKLMEVGVPEEKLFVRPLYLDSSPVQPSFEEGGYVLYLGRLSEEKGLWTLLRIAAKLKKVKFKIAGTGPLESVLRSFAAEKELNNVDFVGVKTGGEKWELLRGSSLVIAPSECYETFGLVVLEAYAAGKPVVGSDLGSLPFVIEDGQSGMLFRCGDEEDAANKILYLLSDSRARERMGRRGRLLVEGKYSVGEAYQALNRVFCQVIGDRGQFAKVC